MIQAFLLSIGDIIQHRFKEGFYSDPYKRLVWYVIIATIPVGLVGVLFESQVESLFAGALYVPAFSYCNQYYSLLVSKNEFWRG